jgi:uncharacterized RDD family membrane protein YckC
LTGVQREEADMKHSPQAVCGTCGTGFAFGAAACTRCGAAVQTDRVFEFAEWWERLMATVIDVSVIGILSSVCQLLRLAGITHHLAGQIQGVAFGVGLFTYFVIMDTTTGQTLGRMVFRTEVLTERETRIGIGSSIVRNIFKMLGLGGFLITLLFITCTKRSQRIGDRWAGTIVVKDVTERARGKGRKSQPVKLLND